MEHINSYYSQENLFASYSNVTDITCGDTVCSKINEVIFYDSGPRMPQRAKENCFKCFRITSKPLPENTYYKCRMYDLNMFA